MLVFSAFQLNSSSQIMMQTNPELINLRHRTQLLDFPRDRLEFFGRCKRHFLFLFAGGFLEGYGVKLTDKILGEGVYPLLYLSPPCLGAGVK